jgi:hypothetical protein
MHAALPNMSYSHIFIHRFFFSFLFEAIVPFLNVVFFVRLIAQGIHSVFFFHFRLVIKTKHVYSNGYKNAHNVVQFQDLIKMSGITVTGSVVNHKIV